MTGDLFEMKYELDSLAAFMLISNSYYTATKDTSCFQRNDGRWMQALQAALSLIVDMQQDTDELNNGSGYKYLYEKSTTNAIETQMQSGRGAYRHFILA